MKREHLFVAVFGMFLLAYLLEAVSSPLPIALASPYEFLSPDIMSRYPFTTAVVVIRGLAIFLTPLLFASLIERRFSTKAVAILIIAVLIQLYAVQDVVSGNLQVTLEWSLSLAFAGMLLFIPTIIYFIRGSAEGVHKKLRASVDPYGMQEKESHKAPEWIEDK